jgi:PAS domain S-box-containing protein
MKLRSDAADHPARILIVDDEPHNRQLLEVMLGPGYELLTAASGEEALATVARQLPDLVLLDVMMPGMDGYAVVATIKGQPATSNIPVIMITALDDRNSRLLGLNAGAEDFLTKPVDRTELCVRVRNLLRLKAYADYHDRYNQILEGEVASRTAELLERTRSLERQAAVLSEQAALLDLAQDAIIVRDMNGRIVFWNRGAEVIYGWSSHEAVGQIMSDLLKEEASASTASIDRTLLRQGQWDGEETHHTRDGAELIMASRWALQRDVAGAPVRILTIHNNITDHKKAEAALEKSRGDQIRFKDEFLSHVSHELRSPLTAVKQFTTILLGGLAGELNKEQREYQQIVLKNIRQLQSMIDDLLEVTRLETGKLTIEPESIAIADAVTDTINTLQVTARAKGVTLSSQLPADLPAAYADQIRLQQILIILIENAIKFTGEGGAIVIEAALRPEDPGFMVLEVSDTGCGISPDVSEHVFERLYQATGHSESSRKGLGLGLYICKELVTLHGGRIWVTRRPQRGSTFSFTLPVSSVRSVIAPLFKNARWPADSIGLVMVEASQRGVWPSRASREEWSHHARALVHGCLLPDLDVLLPSARSDSETERLFVACFTDEKGAASLANRIHKQLERARLKHPGLTLSVSHYMLPDFTAHAGESAEQVVTRLSAQLEESINHQPSLRLSINE